LTTHHVAGVLKFRAGVFRAVRFLAVMVLGCLSYTAGGGVITYQMEGPLGNVAIVRYSVAVAIDSVERVTGVSEHVLQIRRDERGIVVTVAAIGAGPMDGETDVRVGVDERIWSVEPLR
jgi:hypothetical protein